MAPNNWPTEKWPADVPREISGFEKPAFSILDDSADKYPEKVCTIFNGASRTYSQVRDTANRVAAFLVASGIKKGERVAIFLPNIAHYPAVYFGILKAGAVCVTCNPLYTASELNYQLKDSGVRALFCMDHPQFYPTTVEAIKGTDVETVVICNIKSSLPPLKAFLGGLLGKIPKAGR
jgi:long-chain acyl-CoA synthetase